MSVIVVFDAHCLLCSRWVKFLLKFDQRGVFRFASIQGETGQALLADAGLRVDRLETLLLVDGKRSWQHTAAILRVLHALGWPWRAAWLGWLLPSPIRDAAYRLVARNRYVLFGRSETCLMPPADYSKRFLN
jgi:predicted DCC family thiol-disulfide oxidoreductase YuxK